MRIGVIADTHGKVLPEVHQALAGVSLILHAGDIGGEEVIWELETIARVIAVRGNTDAGFGPPQFPDTRRLTLEGVDIFLCHEPARAAIVTPSPDVIIHGHTHQPKNVLIGETLWFNPGTASKPQFGRNDLTVGILTLDKGTVHGEIVPLR
ncbi:MAG: metallophosphoesterase family protein [Armatimonadota bacterium]